MSEEKKIIVDEDWKSQVEAEKEQAAQRRAGGSAESAAPSPPEEGDPEMPPASFELLLTTLATETLVALGQLPHPATGSPHVQRNQAKFLIDTIDVLREKTKGNLTSGEQQMTESLLHQLRLVFVETGNLSASTSDAPSNT